MGFFKRLKNVVEAKANQTLDKHEDPIQMLDLSITKKESLLQEAKKQCANFIASVESTKNEKKELELKVQKYEEATKAAILRGEDEKAQTFVKQKLEIQQKVDSTIARINEQDKKVNEVKFKIDELQIELSKMKSKKQELATRLEVANVSNKINETLAGLNDDHGINLDELEKKVMQKENYSKALEDMKPKNEDDMLDEYIKSSPSQDSKVNDELERIKREMNK